MAGTVSQAFAPLDEPGTWFWARSWSPDGRIIAGDLQGPTGVYSGVGAYSLQTGRYQRLTKFGAFARWLSDGRRLIFADEQKMYLVDAQSRRIREIFSVIPHELGAGFALSPDGRLIVFGLQLAEADIWLMNIQLNLYPPFSMTLR